jgi:hypothetical protein
VSADDDEGHGLSVRPLVVGRWSLVVGLWSLAKSQTFWSVELLAANGQRPRAKDQ